MTSPRAETAEHPRVGDPVPQPVPPVIEAGGFSEAAGTTAEPAEQTVLAFSRVQSRVDRARAVRRRRSYAIAGIATLAGMFCATVLVLDVVH